MIYEFSTLGSCASRNIFNSQLNPDYKKYFHINQSIEVVTLISLMSNPIDYDSELIDSEDKYSNQNVQNDLNKSFLNFLKEDSIDYLIYDTYFDVLADTIKYGENQYITNSVHLERQKFNELLLDKEKINMRKDFNEYIYLWIKSCNEFFNFIEDNKLNFKIILNLNRSVSKYYDNNELVESDNLKNFLSLNKYRDILDKYVLENFDVEVLPFDKNTLALKDHIFGLGSTHYEAKYYSDKTKQLNEIIERNSTSSQQYNKYTRLINRIKTINQFE